MGEVLEASLEQSEREVVTEIEKRVGLSAMRNKRKIGVADLVNAWLINAVDKRPSKKAMVALN